MLLNNKIYTMGGVAGTCTTCYVNGNFWEYDVAGDTWATRSPGLQATAWAVAIKGQVDYTDSIYVLGGLGSESRVQVYVPSTSSWVVSADMQTPRYDAAGVIWGGEMYVIGGHDFSGPVLAVNESFNPNRVLYLYTKN